MSCCLRSVLFRFGGAQTGVFWGDMNLKYHVVNRFYLPARVLCVFYDNIDKVYVTKNVYHISCIYCNFKCIQMKYHVSQKYIYRQITIRNIYIYITFDTNTCHTYVSSWTLPFKTLGQTPISPQGGSSVFFPGNAEVQRLCQSHLRRSYASSVRDPWSGGGWMVWQNTGVKRRILDRFCRS